MNSLYMTLMTNRRSLRLSDEESLAGGVTISVETCAEFEQSDFYIYIQENFDQFLPVLRLLSLTDQELLLSYFVVGKPQGFLGKIDRCTQTQVSTRIRRAEKVFGCFLLYGGPPTEEILARVFTKANLEDQLGSKLSSIVTAFIETGSYRGAAARLSLRREDVRRTMSKVSQKLADSTDRELDAIGNWMASITDKQSSAGVGLTKRQRAKYGLTYRHTDPALLGEFTVDVLHPDFEEFCTAMGNR